MDFVGHEKFGMEMFGHISAKAARDITGGNIPIDDQSGRVACMLSVVQLEGVRHPKLPLKFDYVEALWKVAIVLKKRAAWLIVATDVDQPVARGLVGFLMGYPTRGSNIDIDDKQRVTDISIRTGEVSFGISAELNTSSPPQPEKKILAARDGARFFRVPWGGGQAKTRQGAFVRLTHGGLCEETFGEEVTWEETATVWHGREHACGSPEAMSLV